MSGLRNHETYSQASSGRHKWGALVVRKTREKDSYIIANWERGKVKKTVFLYEDGSAEIKDVRKIRKCPFFEQHYGGIKYYMDRLGNPGRDLRGQFHSRLDRRQLPEVLDDFRAAIYSGLIHGKSIPLSELERLFRKDEIELRIGMVMQRIARNINRRCWFLRKEERAEEYRAFLKKIGFEP